MSGLNGSSSNGASSSSAVDPALHSLAISISREINLVNPNDMLAQRVLDLALQNDTVTSFQTAAKTFGRFRDTFLQEVWMDARANKFTASGAHNAEMPSGGISIRNGINGNSSVNGHAKSTGGQGEDDEGERRMMVGNLVIEDSEVMMPPKQAPGGLQLPGGLKRSSSTGSGKASPIQSPRSSELGLDRLAAEKRRERLLSESGSDRESKRSKYDSEDDSNDSDSMGPAFKSESSK